MNLPRLKASLSGSLSSSAVSLVAVTVLVAGCQTSSGPTPRVAALVLALDSGESARRRIVLNDWTAVRRDGRSSEGADLTGESALALVPALARALSDSHVEVRRLAAISLAELGRHGVLALPSLIEALGDTDSDVAVRAAGALESVGPGAIPELVEVARRNESREAKLALRALAGMGERAQSALPSLRPLLRGPRRGDFSSWVEFAIRRIEGTGRPRGVFLRARRDAPAVFASDLASPAASERRRAAAEAAEADELGGVTDRALRRALNDGDVEVRRSVALALYGRPAELVLPATKDQDAVVRMHAIRACGQLRPTEAVVSAVEQSIEDQQPEVGESARAVLRWLVEVQPELARLDVAPPDARRARGSDALTSSGAETAAP